MINLKNIKSYCRIDHDDEDEYLNLLLQACSDYLFSLTGLENYPDSGRQYDLAALMLISHWYARREAVSDTNSFTTPLAFNSLLIGLRPNGGLVNV